MGRRMPGGCEPDYYLPIRRPRSRTFPDRTVRHGTARFLCSPCFLTIPRPLFRTPTDGRGISTTGGTRAPRGCASATHPAAPRKRPVLQLGILVSGLEVALSETIRWRIRYASCSPTTTIAPPLARRTARCYVCRSARRLRAPPPRSHPMREDDRHGRNHDRQHDGNDRPLARSMLRAVPRSRQFR